MTAPATKLRQAPKTWGDTLARAREDVAAGRTHELEDVLRDFADDITAIKNETWLPDEPRLEAKQDERGKPGRVDAPRMGR